MFSIWLFGTDVAPTRGSGKKATSRSALRVETLEDRCTPSVSPVPAPLEGVYGDLAADYTQWLYSMPQDQHPLFETADVSENQSGNVWFIGGTFVTFVPGENPDEFIGVADRPVEIPNRKPLIFPIFCFDANMLETGLTEEIDLRDLANGFIDSVDPNSLEVVVDGKDFLDVTAFRAESPLFEIG
ncbi:MAG: hypothetical protein ACFCD0_02450, partial [Gemmataceae bacterium]